MGWHYDDEIRIKKLEVQPFGTNCYIVVCPQTNEGVVIDAPGEAPRIVAEMGDVKVRRLIITHTHLDHLGAFQELRDEMGASAAVHHLEASALPSPPDVTLEDGDEIRFGSVMLKVLHTPGHTPGGVCLVTGRHLFSGDTLFPGGPGKTRDAAAFEQIVKSITDKLFVLPDDTIVHPGHGDDAVLGEEKEKFAVFSSRPRPVGLCGDVLWLSS